MSDKDIKISIKIGYENAGTGKKGKRARKPDKWMEIVNRLVNQADAPKWEPNTTKGKNRLD